jgi:hypothetical protein
MTTGVQAITNAHLVGDSTFHALLYYSIYIHVLCVILHNLKNFRNAGNASCVYSKEHPKARNRDSGSRNLHNGVIGKAYGGGGAAELESSLVAVDGMC